MYTYETPMTESAERALNHGPFRVYYCTYRHEPVEKDCWKECRLSMVCDRRDYHYFKKNNTRGEHMKPMFGDPIIIIQGEPIPLPPEDKITREIYETEEEFKEYR